MLAVLFADDRDSHCSEHIGVRTLGKDESVSEEIHNVFGRDVIIELTINNGVEIDKIIPSVVYRSVFKWSGLKHRNNVDAHLHIKERQTSDEIETEFKLYRFRH